jgi:hypothetical protein
VQQIDLADAEERAGKTLNDLDDLRNRLSPELLREMDRAEEGVLHPLNKVLEQETALAANVQQILKRRSPEEAEAELLALLQMIAAHDEADLYSLIMRQIDEGKESIDLSELMTQLQGLFQKNQIGIRIRLL